ncbi:MAG: hypothetical protein KDD78_06595 [Caldilineaceae bacterium]|nr:hypothetical protein [Caldilineaceae bacterium]
MTILGANRNGETLPPAHEPDERGVAMRGIQAIWTICREPRLLLGVLSVALLLVLVALWVPQMPSQLQSNPAAANRWLLDISRELGRGGDILRALGIFNLLSSPLFRTLLLTAAFLLAIQVADQLGVLLGLRQLPTALQQPVKQAGDPLLLPPALAAFRQRLARPQAPAALAPQMATRAAARFDRVQSSAATYADASSANADANGDHEDAPVEQRLLATRFHAFAYLRPLLPLGLLLAVLSLWFNSTFGWAVLPSPLVPGQQYRYPLRDLTMLYPIDQSGAGAPTGDRPMGALPVGTLDVTLGGQQAIVPLGDSTRLNGVTIRTEAGDRGLIVQTEPPNRRMARAGEPAATTAIGLLFPTAGSEESLLIPDESLGIRLVRLNEDGGTDFMVEVYNVTQAAAVQRFELTLDGPQTVKLNRAGLQLSLRPAMGVESAVRHEPGVWLGWLGAALATVGLLGFVRRPDFLVAQIGALSPRQSAVILQSNRASLLHAIARDLDVTEPTELNPPAGPTATGATPGADHHPSPEKSPS